MDRLVELREEAEGRLMGVERAIDEEKKVSGSFFRVRGGRSGSGRMRE